MNDTEGKRVRINEKIAASQDRLRRETSETPVRPNFPDAHPPEDYRSLAAEYPWLTVAGGLALGVIVGSILPKSAGSRLGRRAVGLASLAAELGFAFSKQARTAAGEAAHEGVERIGQLGHRLDDGTAEFRGRARHTAGVVAGKAAGTARGTGSAVVRQAIKLAARARK